MSADCLVSRTFISIDPIHPQIGIDVLNELVADLHRHEEHIGENRSEILGSTSDDISIELIGNGKSTLINVLSQIRINLLILIGAEIGGKKWCDEDESSYSGPNNINNSFDSHWFWPQIIDEIRDILQNLLCVCLTVPEGQELWFTLAPTPDSVFIWQNATAQKASPLDGSEENIDELAWTKFITNPDISLLSIKALKHHTFSVSDSGDFFRSVTFTVKESSPTPTSYSWFFDSANLNNVDGIVGSFPVRPQLGDILVSVHAIWIRPHISSFDLITFGIGSDWSFNDIPFLIEIDGIEIWSGNLNHPVAPPSPNTSSFDLDPFNPTIGDLPELNLFGDHFIEVKIDRENIIRPPEARNIEKEMSLRYGDFVPHGSVVVKGILTVKVIRPAR